MKDEMNMILGEVTDIEAEIAGMIHVLDMLEQSYDLDNQKETVACLMVFRSWAKHQEARVAAVRDELDILLLMS